MHRYKLRTPPLLVMVSACLPLALGCIGKPGGYHAEPVEVYFDEPIVLEFKHIIRGSPGSGAAVRYSNEQVFYRLGSNSEYKLAKLTRTHADRENVIYHATIPPVSMDEGDVLEYYETHLFDGRPTTTGKLNEQKDFEEINASNPYRVKLKNQELP